MPEGMPNVGRVEVYFTALLARTEHGWEASDTELDDVESLVELAELAREAATDDEPVLVCIEQEGAWFGIVRVDGEDDPRVFVSDAAHAMRSAYGEILLTDELLGREPEDPLLLEQLVDLDGTEDGSEDGPANAPDSDEPGSPDAVPAGPLGESGLMADFGIDGPAVLALAPENALGEIADALGCAEVLEAVR
jgi:putative tRNA adenosine deaminase-associated protein